MMMGGAIVWKGMGNVARAEKRSRERRQAVKYVRSVGNRGGWCGDVDAIFCRWYGIFFSSLTVTILSDVVRPGARDAYAPSDVRRGPNAITPGHLLGL